jgi:phage repressor protein C with HTH and peptisase S24 domain
MNLQKKANRSNSVISNIRNGGNQPSKLYIKSLLDLFPDVSNVWLLTGEGTMLKDGTMAPSDNAKLEKIKKEIRMEVEAETNKMIAAYIKTAETMEKLNEYQAHEIIELKKQLAQTNNQKKFDVDYTNFSVNEPKLTIED